jgi:hypothetical protein
MSRRRLFSHEPDVIWAPHLHAFVHTRLQLGVHRDLVEDDLETAIASGDVVDDDRGIAGFCAGMSSFGSIIRDIHCLSLSCRLYFRPVAPESFLGITILVPVTASLLKALAILRSGSIYL